MPFNLCLKLRRFAIEMVPAIIVLVSLADFVFKAHQTAQQLDSAAEDGQASRMLSDDGGGSDPEAKLVSIGQKYIDAFGEPGVRMGLGLAGSLFVIASVITLIPIITFRTPNLVDAANESIDLALCFHYNRIFEKKCVLLCKFLMLCIALGGAGYIFSNPDLVEDPAGLLLEAYLPLIVAFKTILGLFPAATACTMTYSQYQNVVLKDGDNKRDRSCIGLFLPAAIRVMSAVAAQVSHDAKSSTVAKQSAKPQGADIEAQDTDSDHDSAEL